MLIEKNKISVIVPVYNVEKYVSKCLASIIGQSYKNLEIIVVNDGSTDNSGVICDEYARSDNRVTVIHQKNSGVSSARNSGLEIATGELIGFVDGDDFIDTNMYEELVRQMIDENADIVCCAYKQIYPDKVVDFSDGSITIFNGMEMFEEYITVKNRCMMSPAVWNRLFKKELFENLKFENGRIFEDKKITCETLTKIKKGVYVNKTYYNYVQRDKSITRKMLTNGKIDDFIFMNKYQNEMVEKHLSKECYAKCLEIYYCILLDYFCKSYKNKNIQRKKELKAAMKEVRSVAIQSFIQNVHIPKKDKILLKISAYNADVYYFFNKVL